MKIQFIHFIPSIVCLVLAMISIPLIYLPVTEIEQRFWQKLKIRILRHWVTKNGTEKWAQKGTIHKVAERSRKNIAWHGIITFTFCFLIFRAQFIDNGFIQCGSQLLLLPSIAYLFGSIIQRQKMVIIIIRNKSLCINAAIR
jgi:hypothetical protein